MKNKTLPSHVTDLWDALGNVPIDEDDQIEIEWCGFGIGTHREEIWSWFESEFDCSVAVDLMRLEG